LPAALAAVADGGEVWMLDSANYNVAPVNISKSVTILAVPGAVGSVVATAGHAININTVGVKVVLRNLTIVPAPRRGRPGRNQHERRRPADGREVPHRQPRPLGHVRERRRHRSGHGHHHPGQRELRPVDSQRRARHVTRATISGNGNYGVHLYGPAPVHDHGRRRRLDPWMGTLMASLPGRRMRPRC
jgi:hypothetical protein